MRPVFTGASAALYAILATAVLAEPIGDPIPGDFHGTWAPTVAACADNSGRTTEISRERIASNESTAHLAFGLGGGTMTRDGRTEPVFFGRFYLYGEGLISEGNIYLARVGDRLAISYPADDVDMLAAGALGRDQLVRCERPH